MQQLSWASLDDCPDNIDEVRIEWNIKAQGGKPCRGGGLGCVGQCGYGGGCCGYRGNNNNNNKNNRSGNSNRSGYAKGNWKDPEKDKTVRDVDGMAYAACKTCGRKKWGKAYTTGAHSFSQKKGYFVSYDLKFKMKNIIDDDSDSSESKEEERRSKKKKGINALFSLVEMCLQLERDNIDHNKSSYIGQLDHILIFLAKE